MLLFQRLADTGAGTAGSRPQPLDQEGRMADEVGFAGERFERGRRIEPLHHAGRGEDRPDAGRHRRGNSGEGVDRLDGARTHVELIACFGRLGNGENCTAGIMVRKSALPPKQSRNAQ